MWKTILILCSLFHIVTGKTIILGDSMFAGGSSIPQYLKDWSGNNDITTYAKVGASLHPGWVLSIPEQYNMVPFKSNISTIIMNGGGNDVYSYKNDCLQMNDKCLQVIQESIDILQQLLENFPPDCSVIYLGFHYIQNLRLAVDRGMESLSEICKEENNCFLVDPRPLNLPLGWDGIHPTSEGYQKMAMAIWDVSLAHNIEI